jgi:uncharacterized protein (DUF1330 family)
MKMTQALLVFVQFEVNDFARYRADYASKMAAVAAQFGGQFLAATPQAEAMEGALGGNFTAILRFPSREAAQAMYDSEAYAPLKRLRQDELTTGGQVLFIPALDSAA